MQLLAPLRVGPVELPNRVVSTSHQTSLVADHLPSVPAYRRLAAAVRPHGTRLLVQQGRRPRDELWGALEARPGAVRAGDVLGPRSLEEAILEGDLAGRGGAHR